MDAGGRLERLTTTRNGTIALGIGAAVLAAILLGVYITQYRSSVAAGSGAQSVLVAKKLIARGTPGSVIAVKQLYTTTTLPDDQVKSGAITDPQTIAGSVAATDIYPGQQLAQENFTAGGTASGVTATLAGNQRAVSVSIDTLKGSLASLQTGDRVDIYQQLTGSSGVILKLFRANVAVLQAPGATEGAATVILQVPTRDVADLLYAAGHTELFFALRPASGATPTVPRVADEQSMQRFSRTH